MTCTIISCPSRSNCSIGRVLNGGLVSSPSLANLDAFRFFFGSDGSITSPPKRNAAFPQTDINEGGIHARQNATDDAFVDVANDRG